MYGYLGCSAVSLLAFSFVRDEAMLTDAWSLVVTVVVVTAILLGLRVNRPLDRRPWHLIVASAASVAAGSAASIVYSGLGKTPDFPAAADMLPLVGAMTAAVALAIFVRRSTAARDWGTIADAGVVTLAFAGVAWLVLVEPAVTDTSLDLAARLGVVASFATGAVLIGFTARLLLTTAVEGMPEKYKADSPNAGAMFLADTGLRLPGTRPHGRDPDRYRPTAEVVKLM